MMQVEARVLQPPEITYGGNKKTRANNGCVGAVHSY
jgi:hypothetical protein